MSVDLTLWGPRPFFAHARISNEDISASKGRTEFNNHFKMFRRFTLWGTDHGLKVIRLSVFELWASPFFRTRDFGRKMENLHYIEFV